jgi:serine/threonine-protein kinase SRPK3
MKILNNNYVLIYKLGSGAFSQVWLTYDFRNAKFVAIKIQNTDDYSIAKTEIKYLNKIKTTSKLDYLNTHLGHFTHRNYRGKNMCIIFDVFAGSLYDLIKCGKYSNGLPLNIVKNIVRQVLHGLSILHDEIKIIHADLKPENILFIGDNYKNKKIMDKINALNIDDKKKMFINDGCEFDSESELSELSNFELNFETVSDENEQMYTDCCKIKISDFGCCHDIDKQKKGEIQTRYYRAPEIILKCEYTKSIDIWSVGCIVYELITGEILFNPPKSKNKKYDRDIHHLFLISSILGPIPSKMLHESKKIKNKKYHVKSGKIPSLNELLVKYSNLDYDNLHCTLDFLKRVLTIDPNNRYTINECLKHPWLN